MSVSAAQAIANWNANHAVAPQVVADTAANMVTYLSGLQTLQTAGALASVTLLGTGNRTGAAKLAVFIKLANFALAPGATLVAADTAANLLNPGYAAGLTLATSVLLTGAANAVNAGQAAKLAALPSFSLAVGATLAISDTATSLLLPANAAGIARATAVQLTGTSNSVTAAQAVALAAMPAFVVAAGATLTITGANVISAAQAIVLAGLKGWTLAPGGLLLINGSNTVSAAQATAIAGLPGMALASGATLAVNDSAANLLNPAFTAGLAKATAVQLSGTANTVSVAQAKILAALRLYSMGAGTTLVIADTAFHFLMAPNAAGKAFATAALVTGTANTVSAAQSLVLAGIKSLSVAPAATLIVADTATNLLLAGYASGVAKATSVRLTGTSNSVTALRALALAALPNFALEAGATLTIKGINSVTAAQSAALVGILGWTLIPGATLTVADTSADLLNPAYGAGLGKATGIHLLGNANVVTASQAKTLAGMKHFLRVTGSTLVIADTASHFLQSGAAALSIATATQLIGTSNVVSPGQATTLAGLLNFSLASGAKLLVAGMASNLLNASNAKGIAIATKVQLTGSSNFISATQTLSLLAIPNFTFGVGATFSISGANSVSAAQAAALAGLESF